MLSGTGRRRSRLRLSIDRAFLISASILTSTGLRFEARRASGVRLEARTWFTASNLHPRTSNTLFPPQTCNVKLET